MAATHYTTNFYESQLPGQLEHPRVRVFACGTLFQTHVFQLPTLPSHDAGVVRAHTITKSLNGSAPSVLMVLSLLGGFIPSELLTFLVAPLGGSEEAQSVTQQLEGRGVSTRYCKIIEGAGVPGAWVLKSKTAPKSVILHNPLPDLSHEEFVSLLGPILIPENYVTSQVTSQFQEIPPPDTAPFEWMHVEGRSIQTTLNNLQGLDGLARDRGWRRKAVFSLEVCGSSGGSKSKAGAESLIPFVDVIFFDKAYALSRGYTSPRPFLLAMTSVAPPHALLVVNWSSHSSHYQTFPSHDNQEEGGAALLSIPTKEYLQSSAFVPPPSPHGHGADTDAGIGYDEDGRPHAESVRSGSAFYADGHRDSLRSSSFYSPASRHHSHDWDMYTVSHTPSFSVSMNDHRAAEEEEDEGPAANAPFIASMIYGLTRRLMPGKGVWSPANGANTPNVEYRRWGLDECLRFATELTGRRRHAFRVRQRHSKHRYEQTVNEEVVEQMQSAGWF